MATIALVHGSWHWAGCFEKLTPHLKENGHTTIAIDNASHGKNTLKWTQVDSMATYNAELIEAIESINDKVVLLGHSMGGVTLTHLADIMPEKIDKLIYLAAFMTSPGKSVTDCLQAMPEEAASAELASIIKPVGDWVGIGLDTKNIAGLKEAFCADCSDKDIELAAEHLIKVNSSVPNVYVPVTAAPLERHYIVCRQDKTIPEPQQREMISAFPDTVVHELDSSHSPFLSQPKTLARLINSICD